MELKGQLFILELSSLRWLVSRRGLWWNSTAPLWNMRCEFEEHRPYFRPLLEELVKNSNQSSVISFFHS